jgi:phage internal scaffolding protein
MTKQNHKAECDINNIIKQYQKTGILNHVANSTAEYLNLPSNFDYQDALNTVIAAEDAFNQLPSKVRDRFSNDPASLLAAINNPAMRTELEEFGILKKPASPPPSPPPTPAPPAPSEEGA